jgi:hypothetical protein
MASSPVANRWGVSLSAGLLAANGLPESRETETVRDDVQDNGPSKASTMSKTLSELGAWGKERMFPFRPLDNANACTARWLALPASVREAAWGWASHLQNLGVATRAGAVPEALRALGAMGRAPGLHELVDCLAHGIPMGLTLPRARHAAKCSRQPKLCTCFCSAPASRPAERSAVATLARLSEGLAAATQLVALAEGASLAVDSVLGGWNTPSSPVRIPERSAAWGKARVWMTVREQLCELTSAALRRHDVSLGWEQVLQGYSCVCRVLSEVSTPLLERDTLAVALASQEVSKLTTALCRAAWQSVDLAHVAPLFSPGGLPDGVRGFPDQDDVSLVACVLHTCGWSWHQAVQSDVSRAMLSCFTGGAKWLLASRDFAAVRPKKPELRFLSPVDWGAMGALLSSALGHSAPVKSLPCAPLVRPTMERGGGGGRDAGEGHGPRKELARILGGSCWATDAWGPPVGSELTLDGASGRFPLWDRELRAEITGGGSILLPPLPAWATHLDWMVATPALEVLCVRAFHGTAGVRLSETLRLRGKAGRPTATLEGKGATELLEQCSSRVGGNGRGQLLVCGEAIELIEFVRIEEVAGRVRLTLSAPLASSVSVIEDDAFALVLGCRCGRSPLFSNAASSVLAPSRTGVPSAAPRSSSAPTHTAALVLFGWAMGACAVANAPPRVMIDSRCFSSLATPAHQGWSPPLVTCAASHGLVQEDEDTDDERTLSRMGAWDVLVLELARASPPGLLRCECRLSHTGEEERSIHEDRASERATVTTEHIRLAVSTRRAVAGWLHPLPEALLRPMLASVEDLALLCEADGSTSEAAALRGGSASAELVEDVRAGALLRAAMGLIQGVGSASRKSGYCSLSQGWCELGRGWRDQAVGFGFFEALGGADAVRVAEAWNMTPSDFASLLADDAPPDSHSDGSLVPELEELFRVRWDPTFAPTHPVRAALVKWFRLLPSDGRSKFLRFVTGSSVPPPPGVEQLAVECPSVAISSSQWARELALLPQAHTCTNSLEIPDYLEGCRQCGSLARSMVPLPGGTVAELAEALFVQKMATALDLGGEQSFGLDETVNHSPPPADSLAPAAPASPPPPVEDEDDLILAEMRRRPAATVVGAVAPRAATAEPLFDW